MGRCCFDLTLVTIMVMTTILHGGMGQRTPAGERHIKETFLAGSEFEESLMSHLINSTSLVVTTDEAASLLSSSSNQSYTLASPDKPFEFVDRKYFFSKEKFAEFADTDNTTTFAYTCVYNTSNDEGLFSQIYFPDGEPLSEVVFGCENNKECCGMKCCGDDVLINIIIVGAISAALLFLLFCNIIIGFKKRRDKNRREASKTQYATDTLNTNDNDMVSPDQINIDNRHPATLNGSPANPNVIETLPNENPGKRV